jgi:DNA primase
MLSSDLTKATLEWLIRVTDKFIIALDRDASGEKHSKSLMRVFSSLKCRASLMIPHQGVKDWGECFSNYGYFERVFKQQLFMALQKIGVKNT